MHREHYSLKQLQKYNITIWLLDGGLVVMQIVKYLLIIEIVQIHVYDPGLKYPSCEHIQLKAVQIKWVLMYTKVITQCTKQCSVLQDYNLG